MPEGRILIVDEAGFSRVCSALLVEEGYRAEAVHDIGSVDPGHSGYSLLITSYPFCLPISGQIKALGLPTVVLADHINRELLGILKETENSYCMIKPLDYGKFKSLVGQIIAAGANPGFKVI
jgi:hypothetical protein